MLFVVCIDYLSKPIMFGHQDDISYVCVVMHIGLSYTCIILTMDEKIRKL